MGLRRRGLSMGRWKIKWSRKRAVTGGRFVRPRKKYLVYVEEQKKSKQTKKI